MKQPRTGFAAQRAPHPPISLARVQLALLSVGVYLLTILFLVDLAERVR